MNRKLGAEAASQRYGPAKSQSRFSVPAGLRRNIRVSQVRPAQKVCPVPPDDVEKYWYIGAPQRRWLFVVSAFVFFGVAYSLVGFSTMTYWTLIFLIPLAIYAAETILGLRTSTFPRRVTLPDHQLRVELWRPVQYPSIDVFLPTCGEALELLENTYYWTSRMQWPGALKVHVLDDSGRPDVAALAERFGFNYLARPDGAYNKAGNLQYAFTRTDSEHIVILDADFVPRRDFLSELVPYFDIPDVGIVQSPQFFSSDSSMSWLQRCAGSTQELFYRMIQPSRDAVGAAICVGTSAIYRRAALVASGGFPMISHSEDVYTGLAIAEHGYRVQYVPIIVSRGICPSDMNSFISQQYRWAEGSLKLVSTPEFHTNELMSRRQRLSFWSGFAYYLSTAMNGFIAPLPALVMIWFFPQFVSPSNMLPLVGVLVLWLIIYPLVMKGRWRIEVLRVQTIYAFAHAAAIRDVFFGSTAAWVPSNGGGKVNPVAVRVRRTMRWYLLLTQVAIVFGLVLRIAESGFAVWWAATAFVAINVYLFLPIVALTFRGTRSKDPDRPA